MTANLETHTVHFLEKVAASDASIAPVLALEFAMPSLHSNVITADAPARYHAEDDADSSSRSDAAVSPAISHEAWMVTQCLLACDLQISYSVEPLCGRLMILVSAAQDVLMSEARAQRIKLRMSESMGHLEYHEDLLEHFATNHGGLNEYNRSSLTLLPREDGNGSTRSIFTSAHAQRLVMARIERVGMLDLDRLIALPSAEECLKRVRWLVVQRKTPIQAQVLLDLFTTHGAYRPNAKSIFPTRNGRAVVSELAVAVRRDPDLVISTTGCVSHLIEDTTSLDYDLVGQVCDVCAEWCDPDSGMGKNEMFCGTLLQCFPIHNVDELTYLSNEWGNFRTLFWTSIVGFDPEMAPKVLEVGPPELLDHNTLGCRKTRPQEHRIPWSWFYQPIEEIRDYFGDEVGLMCTLGGLLTSSYSVASIGGVWTMIGQWSYGGIDNNPWTPVYALYMGLWTIMCLTQLARRQAELRFLWGNEDMVGKQIARSQFVGVSVYNPDTGEVEKRPANLTCHRLKHVSSVVVVLVTMIVTVSVATAVRLLRHIEDDESRLLTEPSSSSSGKPNAEIIAEFNVFENFWHANKYAVLNALANLLVIIVFGWIFVRIAKALTDYENHRTELEYANSLVLKIACFEFVNNYFIPFYIGYMQEIPDPFTGTSRTCAGGSCLPELQIYILVLFTVKTLGKQIAVFVTPFAFIAVQALRANVDVYRKETRSDSHTHRGAITEVYKMPVRDQPLDYYTDRVVQFGYVALFASSYPLAPFWAAVNNIIEIRSLGYQLCRGFQRPRWRRCDGLGPWFVFLNVLGFVSVITNASVIAFVGVTASNYLGISNQDAECTPSAKGWAKPCCRMGSYTLMVECNGPVTVFTRMDYYELFATFVFCEHGLLMLRVVVLLLAPEVPGWVQRARDTLEYRTTHVYKTREQIELNEERSTTYIAKREALHETNQQLPGAMMSSALPDAQHTVEDDADPPASGQPENETGHKSSSSSGSLQLRRRNRPNYEPSARGEHTIRSPQALLSAMLDSTFNTLANLFRMKGLAAAATQGHTGRVTCVTAYRTRSRECRVLTSSTDTTAKLWTIEGNCIATLRGHTASVSSVATFYSTSGLQILTGSDDLTAKLWSEEGTCITTIRQPTEPWPAIALTCASGNNRIHSPVLPDPSGRITAVTAFETNPQDWNIVMCSYNRTATVWKTKGTCVTTLAGHTGYVVSVAAFKAGGMCFIVTGSTDGTAKVWTMTTAKAECIATLAGHTDWVRGVACFESSPNKWMVLTASDDRTAKLWTLPLGSAQTSCAALQRQWFAQGTSCILTLTGHVDRVRSAFAFESQPEEIRIVTASDDKTARLWNLDGECLKTFTGHEGAISRAIALQVSSPDTDFSFDAEKPETQAPEWLVLTGSDDHVAQLWNLDGDIVGICRSVPKIDALARIWSTFATSMLVMSFPFDQKFAWAEPVRPFQFALPALRLALPGLDGMYRIVFGLCGLVSVTYVGLVMVDAHGRLARYCEQQKLIDASDVIRLEEGMDSTVAEILANAFEKDKNRRIRFAERLMSIIDQYIYITTIFLLPAIVQTFIAAIDCSVDNAVDPMGAQSPESDRVLKWDRDASLVCFAGSHLWYAVPTLILGPLYLVCALRLSIDHGHISEISYTYQGRWVDHLFRGNGYRDTWWTETAPSSASDLSTTKHAGKFQLVLQLTKIVLSAATDLLSTHTNALAILFAVVVASNLLLAPFLPMYSLHGTQSVYESVLVVDVWTCLMGCVVATVNDRTVESPAWIWYTGVILLPPGWYMLRNRNTVHVRFDSSASHVQSSAAVQIEIESSGEFLNPLSVHESTLGTTTQRTGAKVQEESTRRLNAIDTMVDSSVAISPNTLSWLDAISKRCEEKVPGQDILWSWCLAFSMPDSKLVEDSGTDLGLLISEEAWLIAETCLACDLHISYDVSTDGEILYLLVGAPTRVLVDEASIERPQMRMQETVGTLAFHPDLVQFYATNHGGLNECKFMDNETKWIPRDFERANSWATGQSDNIKDTLLQRVFTSALAQRLVMRRMRRLGHLDLQGQIDCPTPQQSRRWLINHALVNRRRIPARKINQLLLTHGAFRSNNQRYFPAASDGSDVIPQLCSAVRRDSMFVLAPEGVSSSVLSAEQKATVTYQKVIDAVHILADWCNPATGPGREEQFTHTLKMFFAMHDTAELEYLRRDWGNSRVLFRRRCVGYAPEQAPASADEPPLAFGSDTNHPHMYRWPASLFYQPAEEIRDYFGDDIGLYYAFMDKWIHGVLLKSFYATFVMIKQLLYHEGPDDNPLTLIYSLYTGVWSILFIQAWNRRQTELRFLWGMREPSDLDEPRRQFIGVLEINPDTGRQRVVHTSRSAYVEKQVLVAVAVAVACVAAASAAILSFSARELGRDAITGDIDARWDAAAAALAWVVAASLNRIFSDLSKWLTDYENHRTETVYTGQLISKRFVFMLFNKMFLLFYVAFGAEVSNPFTGLPARCPGASCINELQRWVIVVYVIDVVGGRAWSFLRSYGRRGHRFASGSLAETQAYLAQPQRTDDQWMDLILKVRVCIIHCHCYHFVVVRYYVVYLTGIVFTNFWRRAQFGYLVLWAPAFPGGPLLAFVDAVVQIRLDAQTLCRSHRRPVWKSPEGASTWTAVLNVLGFAAVVTNSLAINFAGQQNAATFGVPYAPGYWEDNSTTVFNPDLEGGHGLRLEHNSYVGRWTVAALWLRFLVVEHSSMFVRMVVLLLTPSIPQWITTAQRILDFRSRTIFLTKTEREQHLAAQHQYEAKLAQSRATMSETLVDLQARSGEMRSLFDALDVESTQCLNHHQVGKFFEHMGMHLSDEELRVAMGIMDEDGSGEVQFEELHAWISGQVSGSHDDV